MNKGLLSSVQDWTMHPWYSEGTVVDWLGGLVLVLIASFMWSLVVRQIE